MRIALAVLAFVAFLPARALAAQLLSTLAVVGFFVGCSVSNVDTPSSVDPSSAARDPGVRGGAAGETLAAREVWAEGAGSKDESANRKATTTPR
jgi:hypothetical protein